MNWELCVICQQRTRENLQCPADSKRKDFGASYTSFARNVKTFQDLNLMPTLFNIDQLDNGSGMEETLLKHRASWHKSCRDLFGNTKLERAQKRKQSDVSEPASPVKARRSSSSCLPGPSKEKCFFCDETDSSSSLHAASTLGVDNKVRECALLLNDGELLAKLSASDMVAADAKYHTKCLVSLYNRARQLKSPKDTAYRSIEGVAFAELIAYIDDCKDCEEFTVLKLADLARIYSAKLEELGAEPGRINTSRLKERLLAAFPDIKALPQGRDILLAFNQEIGDVLKRASEDDCDTEACHLAKAAKIVRRDILQLQNSFQGTFPPNCQSDAVPSTLQTLVNMILKGPTVNQQPGESDSNQACLSISQLLMFNSISRDRNTSSSSRHTREKECPLPIYVALKIHGATRGRSLIDAMFSMGICISYDRLLALSTDIANSVCTRFESDGIVCPPKLRGGLFTTAAVDNIDHNPSSTSAHDSFHGTAISLVQHPTSEVPGIDRGINAFQPAPPVFKASKKVAQLPHHFLEVPPAVLSASELYAPQTTGRIKSHPFVSRHGDEKERDWLDQVKDLLSKEELAKDDAVSWAAYRASQVSLSHHEPAIISLLPLFMENAHSAAMILHAMNVIKSAVKHVNPVQVPVIAFDQPLYTLAKQIQWELPNTHGEDHFVVMFGGLHVEMAAFKVLGKWLSGSGWTDVLSNAGVATPGVSDSFLAASHLTRTRRAHQITAAALHLLQNQGYAKYVVNAAGDEDVLAIEEWRLQMSKKSPHFLYWSRVLDLELYCLQLVRALREADFALYVETLTQIVPWMFALDHINYSRWLPVHIRDMCELPVKHADVFQEFNSGSFVVHKTNRPFSAIALDHAHEQENASIKGDGGAVGLTENPAALRRWMVSGPEIARMIKEFENLSPTCKRLTHHEQTPATQLTFKQDVVSVVCAFEELGNPFEEEGEELFAIHTRDVMDSEIVETVQNIVKVGKRQYDSFVQERLIDRSKPIAETIKKNNLPLISTMGKKCQTKEKAQVAALKEDCTLFSRLYIACQCRDGNLKEFFKYENQPWPPALSQMNQLRGGQKSDLVKCLESVNVVEAKQPSVDAIILDGAVAVQMLTPGAACTFQEYIDTVFMSFINKLLESANRIDIVWDVYLEDSLKSGTREKRGSGTRRKVLPSTRIPSNWRSFLRVDDNKTELFYLLAQQAVTFPIEEGKELYSTCGELVLTSANRSNLTPLEPCNHEEADTRLLVHALDACLSGHRRIMIKTNDADVVVLAVSVAESLPADEIWISYGTGKHLRHLAVHKIALNIGMEKAKALPLFHAITGCDTVSFFVGKGKKTAWDVWSVFPGLTNVLLRLMLMPEKVDDACMAIIERFVVLLYDRTSAMVEVNQARQDLFSKKSRSLENIPPTRAALEQHTMRAVFQGAYIWGQVLVKQPVLPPPSAWGWERDGKSWKPKWTTLPQAKDTCYELIHCSCKKGCKGRCKCVKANLDCTGLCNCGGNCH